jgi:hypothetical protein
VAKHYGLIDANGRQPPSCRDTHKVVPHVPFPNVIR